MNYLANNLAFLRKENKVSQVEIHDRLGFKPNTFSNWERGVSEPGIEIIIQICDFFKINIQDIINTDLSKSNLIEKEGDGKNHYKSNLKSNPLSNLNYHFEEKTAVLNEPKAPYNNDLNELVKMKQLLEEKNQRIAELKDHIQTLKAELARANTSLQEPHQSKRKAS